MKLDLNTFLSSLKVEYDAAEIPPQKAGGKALLSVKFKDEPNTIYIIKKPSTSETLQISHFLMQMASPMIGALAPQEGSGGSVDYDAVGFALASGVGAISGADFSLFVRFLMTNVSVRVNGSDVVEFSENNPMAYEAHFSDRLGHLGALVGQVIKNSGLAGFFAGLVQMLTNILPSEDKSEAKSPPDTSTEKTGS